ncbi:MAG: type II secretion system protein GspK [Candidatus Hinthialibacter antarcticus]|nr:type II secretion system protein GspK [Candidatus Hinthialibacter antarcticus]
MRASERGIALIVVLWIVTVMGTFTMLFSRESRLAVKINKNLNDALQAEMLAEAGVYRAVAELIDDYELTTFDSLNETWSNSADAFFDATLGDGVYRVEHPDFSTPGSTAYGCVDECSKLNINTATRDMILALPYATEELADAILDWRDENDEQRTFGAEIDYYQSLEEPYQPKNGQFDTLGELMLVRGVSVEVLYGEDINSNGLLDLNENDGESSFPIDDGNDELNLGWIHYLTVYSYEKNESGDGLSRININSANEDEMKEELSDVLSDEEINQIIQGRDGNEYTRIGDLISRQQNNNNGGGRNNNNNQRILSKEKMRDVADRITTTDDEKLFGLVNLNTAPREVLKCFFPQNEEIVETIIEYRESSDGPLESLGELLDVQGVSEQQFARMTEIACTKSSVFSMRSTGYIQANNAYKQVFAIFDRNAEPPQFIYWKVVR